MKYHTVDTPIYGIHLPKMLYSNNAPSILFAKNTTKITESKKKKTFYCTEHSYLKFCRRQISRGETASLCYAVCGAGGTSSFQYHNTQK